jgi:gas vesicle protein
MTENALEKIGQFGANTALAINKYYQLSAWQSESDYTATTISTLVGKLRDCLSAVATVETTLTLPTLQNVRKDLSACLSGVYSPSQDKITQLVSKLERHNDPLNQVAKQHTDTLSKTKTLERESKNAETSLLNQASQLEQTGKRQKFQGYMTSFAGGMLAIPTFGVSLRVLAKKGDSTYQSGENLLHENRTIKAEMDVVFPNFLSLVKATIRTGELLSGMITSLSAEVRNLSESRSPRQLRKVQAKSVVVDRAIARYITVSRYLFGNIYFYPYDRDTQVICEGCDKEIVPASEFYHCHECSESIDFCSGCYRTRRHESHCWTKHSKAQYLVQGYQICNGCRDVIHGGKVKMCDSCAFELCPRCTDMNQHEHPLHTVEVRWYGDFVPTKPVCDECWCTAEEWDLMFQCLECYWYFVCVNCKIGLDHPHELIRFDTHRDEAEEGTPDADAGPLNGERQDGQESMQSNE